MLILGAALAVAAVPEGLAGEALRTLVSRLARSRPANSKAELLTPIPQLVLMLRRGANLS